MLKKIILFISCLIGCIFLWKNIPYWWLYYFPQTLEEKFAAAIEKKCKMNRQCIIPLHEITSFKWDTAYLFTYDSGYDRKEIQKIIEIQGNFRPQGVTSLFFLKNGKLVKYEQFSVVEDYGMALFPWSLPYINVSINSFTDKLTLKRLNYSGNLDDFLLSVGVSYYKLTPQTDQLFARCVMNSISHISYKQCGLGFTNLDQVRLFNPKTDNN